MFRASATTMTTAAAAADPRAISFTHQTFVFDGLSLSYVLEEPYTERTLRSGVNATNVTFAMEEDWDTVQRNIDRGLRRIEENPLLMLATRANDLDRARRDGASPS